MEFKNIRWRCMITAMILALFSGIGYAWSVFQTPLLDSFNWDLKTISLTFTIQVLTSTVSPIFLGKFQKKIGVANYLRIGIAVYSLGLIATRFTPAIMYLYVIFGVVVGIGIGMLYPCLVAYGTSLFPEKTGFASGLMAGSYGFGAVIWAPSATFLMKSFDVLMVFAILGLAFIVVMFPLSFLIKEVPEGYKDTFVVSKKKSVNAPSEIDYTWKDMLKSYKYYILVVVLTLGATAGLMITGHASGIMQQSLGFSQATAAMFVGFLSISNTAGRLILGPLSDKIGRYNTMIFQFAAIGIAMFILTMSGGTVFIIALLVISACYGGFTSMIAPVCADNFGLKYHAVNYTFLYVAYGLAGVVGPQLAASIKEASGGYTFAFLTVAAMSAVGLILVLFLKIKGSQKGVSHARKTSRA
ncbi:MAG: OFA family MFS transporter [Suipraeoptans sp.]